MHITIDTMNTKVLRLTGLSVATQEKALNAIGKMDFALAYVSNM